MRKPELGGRLVVSNLAIPHGGTQQSLSRGGGSGAGCNGRLDRQAWLDEQLDAAWQRCNGAGQRGTIALEATYDEIVDFTLTAPSDTALTTCMRAQIWALELPSDFFEDRSNWIVELC
jgi:hypothetical protein